MIIEKAKEKIEESKYFLQKMVETESSCDSSDGAKDREKEFSHLLSAFLNSCYSVGEILKQEEKYFDLHKNLRLKRRDIYKNGKDGGWRTIAVHYKPVKPQHDGYIPPPADKVNFNFTSDKPYTPPAGDKIVFDIGQNKKFYFTKEIPQNSITDFCNEHMTELVVLITECENI
ncbi:hypothetical protein H206_03510 [Candidatus Electrothrix aarhusensis]|uniref:Uncharacterized protein n=1 Tax=Candidatus Electrothrix aarhusensis TaxID=1859131 RepID=A0A444J161_9BACT|nr:hypothetical protein H206_03510 [Candidatus Electrothrix aarhusensis]